MLWRHVLRRTVDGRSSDESVQMMKHCSRHYAIVIRLVMGLMSVMILRYYDTPVHQKCLQMYRLALYQ